ncbi:MAG: transcription elongation factor GreA [Clostridia bacterium]|nr:transcription elongation factor GreA [Clostridia bacterium]
MEKKVLYTEEGFAKLKEEYDYLINVRRPEIKEALAVARSFGDLSENSEYDEAKDQQAKVETRIVELKSLIEHAEVVKESQMRSDVVSMGSAVKLLDIDAEEELDYVIVGSNEADPLNGRISDQSPIGMAIIGSTIGDVVTVAAPTFEYKVKILEVQRAKALEQ